jgi:hypothetical protein
VVIGLYAAAVAVFLLAASLATGWYAPLGRGSGVWLAKGTLRLERRFPGSGADGWSGHPWEVRVRPRAGGSLVVEVGAFPLVGLGAALTTAGVLLRPRPLPKGVCARCEYDLGGLEAEVRVCPECATPLADRAARGAGAD